jgi:pimeloyl-ACP methyl ester carboxylesterase
MRRSRDSFGRGLMVAMFVLVHGGWEAGWVWRTVEEHLRSDGHEVLRPTLTGLGERSHLLNPAVDLETHITDILNLVKWERLGNVTLVGHSYGGMVATGVADRVHDHIRSLIYLDAFMPKSGQSLFDLLPSERVTIMLKLTRETGDGWSAPVAVRVAGPIRHVREASNAALLRELCVEHPLPTFSQKLNLTGNHLKIARKAFVFASGYMPSTFARFADKTRLLGWPVEDLPTHHFPMLSMPRETANALMAHKA